METRTAFNMTIVTIVISLLLIPGAYKYGRNSMNAEILEAYKAGELVLANNQFARLSPVKKSTEICGECHGR